MLAVAVVFWHASSQTAPAACCLSHGPAMATRYSPLLWSKAQKAIPPTAGTNCCNQAWVLKKSLNRTPFHPPITLNPFLGILSEIEIFLTSRLADGANPQLVRMVGEALYATESRF